MAAILAAAGIFLSLFFDSNLAYQQPDHIMASSSSSSSSAAILLTVEHSLDSGASFSPRGTLSVFPAGSAAASFDPEEEEDPGQIRRGKTRKRLETLCQSDDLYLVRFVAPRSADGHLPPQTPHRSAIRACSLLDSDLDELFTVQLDWRNRIAAITITAEAGNKASSGSSGSSTLVQTMETGPQPDTAAFVQRLEQEKLAKERGEAKDNRSFFAKYWMYIIPVVLVLAMGSGGGDSGGGGGGR